MEKLFIEDINLENKRVLCRVDFNVPLQNSEVANDKRIKAALPTIEYILKNNGKLILMSHLGRPKGKRVPELSLRPVADRLKKLVNSPVYFVDKTIGNEVKTMVNNLKCGEILLLENLRFHAEETENSKEFSRELADLCDIYINDAFGTAHRAHASTYGITEFVDTAAAGYLMEKELNFLGSALKDPKRPFTAIIGGAKISGKIDVIDALLPKVDHLLIGGGMALTFAKARGYEIGKSLCEDDKLELAKKLLEKGGEKIVLPVDYTATDILDIDASVMGKKIICDEDDIPSNLMAADIGPESVSVFQEIVKNSKTIVWNGPMGVFEIDGLDEGTFAIADAMAKATDNGAITIIGGGDSASAIEKSGLASRVSHVSTGGGASLKFLEGKKLPGVEALSNKKTVLENV